jgi:general secretion pathway protein N
MANFFRQNPLAFLLSVVAAVLLAIIIGEVAVGFWPRSHDEAKKHPAVADVKMLPPVASVVADAAYPESASRPLFTPTRRPAPAAAVAGNMQRGQFLLTGVIAAGDHRVALLKEKTSGKVHRVERGKEVNGMTLSVVEPEKVTLAQGGDEEVLTLQVAKAQAAPAPGQPAQPGAAAPAPSGPFASGPAAGHPGGAAPGAPGPVGAPAATPAVARPPAPVPNPAQRSGFGPFQQAPAGTSSETATPMTPEELLARRRARRGQQPNQ